MEMRALAVVTALLLAACASEGSNQAQVAAANDGSSGKECFWLHQVNGFNKAGRNQVLVNTGPNERFLFETLGPCPDLQFSETLAFEQRGPGRICRGIDVNIIVPDAAIPRKCPVKMIKKLTKKEAKAL